MTKRKRIKKHLTVQCSQCGVCCGEHIATLTHHDLRRLVKATGIPAHRMVRFFGSDEMSEVDDDDMDWVWLSYGRRQMGLRKKNGHCLFLSQDRQCTVYEARPLLCRTYPLEVTLTDDNEVDDLQLRDIIRDKSVTCEYSHGKPRSLHKIQSTAVKDETESGSFWNKLTRWNEQPVKGRKHDFLAFMGFKTLANK